MQLATFPVLDDFVCQRPGSFGGGGPRFIAEPGTHDDAEDWAVEVDKDAKQLAGAVPGGKRRWGAGSDGNTAAADVSGGKQNGGDADDCARRAEDGDRDMDRDTRGGESDGAWRRAWRRLGGSQKTRGSNLSYFAAGLESLYFAAAR